MHSIVSTSVVLEEKTVLDAESDSVKRLKDTFREFGSADGLKQGKTAKLGPTDVVLVGPRKNGNTWTQQIIHGLRSRGDMDFEEISLAVPELEYWADVGEGPLTRPQRFYPNMFRTHLTFPDVPKSAGKYIVVVRDPHDAAVSLYHYWAHWFFDPDNIGIDSFVKDIWLSRDGPSKNTLPCQMKHYTDWYDLRHDSNVFWLHFEDLKEDLRTCVMLIAKFLELDWEDDSLIDIVTRQADLSFMKRHKDKFDAHQNKKAYNAKMGLSSAAGIEVTKLRCGRTGYGKHCMSEKVYKLVNKRWKAVVEKKTGFKSYSQMRAAINKELNRPFGRSVQP